MIKGDIDMEKKEVIYTHDEATRIIEAFEGLLENYEMKIPSVDDGTDYEIDDEDRAPIFGTEYSELQDKIEEILISILTKAGVKNFVPYQYSGTVYLKEEE